MEHRENIYPHPAYRRVAYAAVSFPRGELLRREVVVFDGEGRPVAHFPLAGETAFTEWRDETYAWPFAEE